MNTKVIVRIGLVLVFLAIGAPLLYSICSPEQEEKKFAKEGYCPDCGRGLPKNGECSYCLIQRLNGKAPAPSPSGFLANLTLESKITVFVFLILAIGAVACWSFLPSFPFRSAKAEPFYTFKCSRCKRKLRYPISKVGQYGYCPGCRQRAIYPDPASAPAEAS